MADSGLFIGWSTPVRGREETGLDVFNEALAFEAQLSLTYVGEIERGQRMVSLDTVVRVATALKLTPAELLSKAEIG